MWLRLGAVAALLVVSGCAGPLDGIDRDTTSATTTTPTTSPETTPTATTSSPTTTSTPPPLTITVRSFEFDPASADAALGATATWQWESGSHTVTIHRLGDPTGQYVHDAPINSGAATVTFTFDEAGTFHVFCKPHSEGDSGNYEDGMVSVIRVG